MSFANGRHYLAIPGPSVIPDPVLQAMQRPAPNIYTGELVELTHGLVPDLKTIAGTQQHVGMYISNGHGLWEAALTNILSRGDKILVCLTGEFGVGWADVATQLGAQVQTLDFGKKSPIDPAQVEQALRADTGHDIKAVLVTHVDTATSLRNDIDGVRKAIDAAGHPALYAVDCVASMGCERFEMDAWGVDVAIAASQKGLMTPAGMGFIWVSDKALEVGQSANMRTPYWDWNLRTNPVHLYEFFGGTPPTQHLYGLRKAVDMMLEEGLDNIFARHAALAGAYWAAADVWAQGGDLVLNVPDAQHRSHAVTALKLNEPDGTRLRDWLTEHMGITLGIPLGMAPWDTDEWHGYFRIGHMGYFNAQMVLGVIGAIETAFIALDIPHGAGGARAAAKFLASKSGQTLAPTDASACCSD
ncbi:pyridoxal-phosphate-dependent aminotransferase family protein [Pacificibacter marinus]|uniref:Soluble hydrogenase 42 kDa subunit n=1 Tax=Pacificibacter marinus TaxID=658057 RepID=A0A1Y5SX18_9RHOB|nr:aminotransferase class V-fold PLP-dependent enzyme [Pacificibacter marinus]SEK66116.1 alanine-glyoxylate transaminase / serine-glyoxylate transaminase / serine-pyruvate transaminase [Pacificibacter marinus]SLN47047.1 Soluble hydrogenase 42 kDa subunit [Pacificibacter marinus]